MSVSMVLSEMVEQQASAMKIGLVQAFSQGSIIIPLLSWIPVKGMEYHYGEQTTLGGIAFRNLGGTYTADVGIVNPKVERLVIMGGTISMDWQLDKSATHVNAIAAKMKAAGLKYDYTFINGSSGTTPTEFIGLKNRIQAAQTVYAGDNGADLTVGMLDELLDKVVGPNSGKVLVMSKYQRRKFKAACTVAAGGSTLDDVTKSIVTYDGARVVIMDEDDVPTTVLPQTEVRGSSGAVCGSIYCIRPGDKGTEGQYVQGLIRGDIVAHKPLAQVNTQISDLVESFCGLGVFHGRSAARLAGLK